MARGKKTEKILTREEKLQEALVPESEWPYKVPGNWLWVYIGAISNLYTGNSINEKTKKEKYCDQSEGLLYIATKDISFDGTINYETNVRINDYEKFKIAPSNTPLLCIEGGSAGRKIGFVNQRVCFVNKLCAFVSEKTNPKLIYYYLQSQCFLDQFNARKHGLIGGVSVSELSAIPFTLTPLSEQHRIVDRIESLFAKLDEAKEKAQAVVDGFEDRKAAILHKAFTGELTEQWRKKREISLSTWANKRLGETGRLERGRSKHRPRNDPALFGGAYPFIQTGDVASAGQYVTSHKQTLSEIGLEQSKLFPAGTLCITIAANIGDVAILTYDCCFPDSVVGFTPYDGILSEYVYHMMTTIQKDLEANAPATAQKNINLKVLNDTLIKVPSLEEQETILKLLNSIFEKEQQIKESAEQVIAQIDTMKKSILARAFRGELGTNDPSDESAEELLKKIL